MPLYPSGFLFFLNKKIPADYGFKQDHAIGCRVMTESGNFGPIFALFSPCKFWKVKLKGNKPRDIMILQQFAKNHNYMMHGCEVVA